MKLRYIKARNVLSFGDQEACLGFGQANVIAGPTDSGKTNLIRVLRLIEDAFDHGKPPLNEIIFEGDTGRPLKLEVAVDLDVLELELLATLILCSWISTIIQGGPNAGEKQKHKEWRMIMTHYGHSILSKSLRSLSFILSKDESDVSQPVMVVQVSDESGRLYINRHGMISETTNETGQSLPLTLTEEIIDDFLSKFGSMDESKLGSLFQNHEKLSEESPTLMKLLKGKLGGQVQRRVDLRGGSLDEFMGPLRGEPLLAKLSRLCEERGIRKERLYIWEILQQMFRISLVTLSELRVSPPTRASSGSGDELGMDPFFGSELAQRLSNLRNSEVPKNREKYNSIQSEFEKLTKSKFDVARRPREVSETAEVELGVRLPRPEILGVQTSAEYAAVTPVERSRKRIVNEEYVQVIRGNRPIGIERTASGFYEILFLLTTIVGESEKVLLLDEPELHLHPGMQKRILNLVSKSVSKRENQVVVITHSPYFLSAAELNKTWRLTRTEKGTTIHNLGSVILEMENKEQEKLPMKISRTDVRAILFSKGVIFVEGLSDKIVVEQIDKHLSSKNEGASIEENEWSIVDIGSKDSLFSYIAFANMLGVPNVAVLDYDALMRREQTALVDGRKMRSSAVLLALWRAYKLKDPIITLNEDPGDTSRDIYSTPSMANLRELALRNGIFVFSKDLEGAMQTPKTERKSKPLKSLQRVLELIEINKIPQEFIELSEFLKGKTTKD